MKGINVMWKKVLYLGVTIIFGFLVYIMSSNSNQMNHLESLVKKAIESEKFYEVPMIWDGCFDTTSIVKNDSDKMDIVLYPATSQTDVTYGPEDSSSRFLKFERAYYLYIFNTSFSLNSVKTDSETSYNLSGIEFSNGTKSYMYYFIANENTNASSYEANPTTKEQAILKSNRDITNTNSVWNFMRVTFTETMLNEIVKELGSDITTLSVKDSEGVAQYTSDVSVNFSQNFFTDVKPLFDNYNIYLDSYLAANGDKNKINEAQTKFNEFYDPWYEEFESKKEETKYTFRFDNDVLSPSKLMWQTIGITALYAVVVVLIYILLFHFKAIKRIFSKENYKKYSSDSKILVNGKWVDRSAAKLGKTTSEKADVVIEPDTKADEALETVTATEVVTEPSPTEKTEETSIPEEDNTIVQPKEEPTTNESVEETNPMEEKVEEPAVTEIEVPQENEEVQEATAPIKEETKAKTQAKKASTTKKTTTKASVSKESSGTPVKKSTSTKTSTTKKPSATPTKKSTTTKTVAKEKKDASN